MSEALPRILVVDDSRVARVSLVHRLRQHFEVREEADGESAWQTLVLDHSIQAVISDLQMPRVDGFGLLERLRTSKLRRLQELPFILVSGEEEETLLERAKAQGASDFITKGACTTEVIARLNNLLALQQARETLEASKEQLVQDPASGLYTRKYLELQAVQAFSHAHRHAQDLSVMVLGFDGFDRLSERLGSEVAEEVAARVARSLAGKMRQDDSLGHFGSGCFAIVSPGTAPTFCVTFAERVRSAVEAARLTFQGESLQVTVSVGVASTPLDDRDSALALLALAEQRMGEAMCEGGNCVEAGGIQPLSQPLGIHQALELLATNRESAVIPHLPALTSRLMPLLQLLNQELGLALPLAEIEHRLSERKVVKK